MLAGMRANGTEFIFPARIPGSEIAFDQLQQQFIDNVCFLLVLIHHLHLSWQPIPMNRSN
jgi:hypothetical protein